MGALGKWFRRVIDPSYLVKHAMAEMELAYGMLERTYQRMENGDANEAGACLFGYAAACGNAKDDLKAVMHREVPKGRSSAVVGVGPLYMIKLLTEMYYICLIFILRTLFLASKTFIEYTLLLQLWE